MTHRDATFLNLTRWAVVAALVGLLAACGNDTTVQGNGAFGGNGADSGALGGDIAGNSDSGSGQADATAGSDTDNPQDAASDSGAPDDAQTGTDDAAARTDVTPDATQPDDVQQPDDTAQPQDTAVAPDVTQPVDVQPDVIAPNDVPQPVDTVVPADVAPADTTIAPDVQPPQDVVAPDAAPDVPAVTCGGVSCDDGNPCTVDECQPTGLCSWSTKAGLVCEDGNLCTTGDTCQGLKCIGGAGKPDCDDKNVCTADSCDPKLGCTHTNVPVPCDDGDQCTTTDICNGGKCQGGLNACDDGKPCTTDTCDKATGNCSWAANTGACDDGNACTTADACANGKCAGSAKNCDDKDPCSADSCDPKSGCVYAPVPGATVCDDGSKCTSNDACNGGKCTGKPTNCDDGNVCTNDACDPATGNCAMTSNTLPCIGSDKCVASSCSNGKCTATAAPKNCDDKNVCTADSCDAATGACVHKAANDGAVCDDGIACTKDSVCAAGGCKPKLACLIFADSFECSAQPTFSYVVPAPANNNPPRKVVWSVDQTPAVEALNGMGCSLNFNDGTDYCDQIGSDGGNQICQVPLGTATSPVLDFTLAGGLLPTVTFDTYYAVDTQSENDTPRVRVLDAASNQELKVFLLPKTGADLKTLKKGYTLTVPEATAKKVKLEFSLNTPSNTSQGNTGVGWFVDNLSVTAAPGTVEVCGNGLDDDFDGAVDCADTQCAALATCKEQCSDTIDNDMDGLTDCADPDCTGNFGCVKPFISWSFDQCASTGWTISASPGNGVTWAVDATPDIGKLPYGACTLNFNNGTNYCTAANCPGNEPNATGSATLTATVDLPAGKKITLAAWVYIDVEDPNGNSGANFDNTYMEISGADFAQGPATISYKIPRDVQKAWVERSVDVSALAGKTVKLRVRFDAGDGQYNNFAGPFFDEIRLFAQ